MIETYFLLIKVQFQKYDSSLVYKRLYFYSQGVEAILSFVILYIQGVISTIQI